MGFKDWMKEGFQKEVDRKRDKTNLKIEEKKEIKSLKKQGVPMCPKCNSQSIQYVERRKVLSVGRAVTGGVLFGGIGAGLGAVTSNKRKGFIKCLNCGNTWKK